MKTFFTFLTTATVLYVMLCILIGCSQKKLIYMPRSGLEATPADAGLEYTDITLTTIDGVKLHSWYIPAVQPCGTLIFCHGNAGNISHRLQSVLQFHQLNLNVLIFDYRGYGHSEGSPDEIGTYRDAEAAWDFLRNERNMPASQIIIFGRSLGGTVASNLAKEHQPAGLIIESSFTSVPEIAHDLYPYLPVRWLVSYKYPSLENLKNVTCPVLICHSPNDEIIPFSHGQRLFAAAHEPKFFIEMTGSHNNGFLETGDTYLVGLQNFINIALPSSQQSEE